MENKMIELLNTIRAKGSALYQERVPVATQENLESIRYAILGEDNVMIANEMVDMMINKLCKSVLHVRRFNNPLAPFKKGRIPLGDTIEEIYTNFLKADPDGFKGDDLFKKALPDVNVVYHRTNLKVQYPVTIERIKLEKAFTSYDHLESFVNSIIEQLYNSAELDEFMHMKELIKSAVDKKALVVKTVSNPLADETSAKKFIQEVKTYSGMMKYPSSEYNSYTTAQEVDTTPLLTFSRYEDQVLILPEAVNTAVDITVLANTFNMSVADFNKTRKVLVDALPVENAVGLLVDKEFFQIYDKFTIITNFFNPKGIYTNYYLNIEQVMAYSILVNGILFTTDEVSA